MLILHITQPEVSQQRRKETKTCKICYVVILSVHFRFIDTKYDSNSMVFMIASTVSHAMQNTTTRYYKTHFFNSFDSEILSYMYIY